MSGLNAEMSSKQEKKALVINDRINSLSIDINDNLSRIREINGFLFASEISAEDGSKKEAKMSGWFEYIIDMLITIGNVNNEINNELERLRSELKD